MQQWDVCGCCKICPFYNVPPLPGILSARHFNCAIKSTDWAVQTIVPHAWHRAGFSKPQVVVTKEPKREANFPIAVSSSSPVSPCQHYLVSPSQRNKSNMYCLSQLFLLLLPSAGSSSVPLMHRRQHKHFHTPIPSASCFSSLYVWSCCQHIYQPQTNKQKNPFWMLF